MGRKKKEPTEVIRIPKSISKALKELRKDKDFWNRLDRMRNEEGKIKAVHKMP